MGRIINYMNTILKFTWIIYYKKLLRQMLYWKLHIDSSLWYNNIPVFIYRKALYNIFYQIWDHV